VFPLAGTDAHDTWAVTNRRNLHSSPAIGEAGRRLFALAGLGPDDVGPIDLYSCFPSAVQVAAAELGFDLDRDLTVTGGLTFAGGPLNNYVTHSIATMVDVLRRQPGAVGLVSANGGFLTKHALGLYSTEPGTDGYTADNVQEAVDRFPTTPSAPDHQGPVTVEAYTVMHGAEGVERALCALRTSDGSRTWGSVTDPNAAEELTRQEAIGFAGLLDGAGSVVLF
jgi:acetyl-CoA C-acetyltransferase